MRTIFPSLPLFILMLLALAAYGQQEQKRVAILNTEDNGEQSLEFTNLTYLTDRLREIAGNTLPEDKYFVMTTQSIIDKMGSKEQARKVCKEATCMAEIGRKISAEYIGQARLGRFGDNLTISMELYHSARGNLIGSFTGRAKDVYGLEAIITENAPSLFRKMPGASAAPKSVPSAPSAPSVEGGIRGLQKASSYEAEEEKLYVVSLSTEPQGAFMSFDGVPVTSCPKTPCKAELAGGNVRIVAALEQYERADTTVLIKQNNQSISIKLKSNFGVLEIKPAYLDGIGKNEQWNLTINGKPSSSWENNLSPGKYSVKLSNECYEN
ncbi:MAG: PEGA domain-containing protein, partial [Fibromonadaceae bacterium]|nr:PEGA domain-containing protein [Fibromonadaceae bacterium]